MFNYWVNCWVWNENKDWTSYTEQRGMNSKSKNAQGDTYEHFDQAGRVKDGISEENLDPEITQEGTLFIEF